MVTCGGPDPPHPQCGGPDLLTGPVKGACYEAVNPIFPPVVERFWPHDKTDTVDREATFNLKRCLITFTNLSMISTIAAWLISDVTVSDKN